MDAREAHHGVRAYCHQQAVLLQRQQCLEWKVLQWWRRVMPKGVAQAGHHVALSSLVLLQAVHQRKQLARCLELRRARQQVCQEVDAQAGHHAGPLQWRAQVSLQRLMAPQLQQAQAQAQESDQGVQAARHAVVGEQRAALQRPAEPSLPL